MATTILDLTALLAPLKGKQPTGKDLRLGDFSNSLYHKIKDARIAARAIERQQMQGGDSTTKPDWQPVYTHAVQALTMHTKDLEIAAWLIEALLREYGFAGLCEGFRLAHGLITHYWDKLFPLPDEDGLLTRLAPLVGLNGEESEGTLITPIALVPLTQGQSVGPFALWQYQHACAQRLASGAVTIESINTAINETSADFLRAQLDALENCVTEFQTLTQLLAEKVGFDAPPSSRILSQLNACIDFLKTAAKETLGNNVAVLPVTSSAIPETTTINNAQKIDYTYNLATRDQVLQSLLQAADFFRRTEPHSPLPYLLERTVKWGKMPLPQLLKELIKDEAALGNVFNLTGVG